MKPRSISSQIPVAVLALVIVACSSISGTREKIRAMGVPSMEGQAPYQTLAERGTAPVTGAVVAIDKIGADKSH